MNEIVKTIEEKIKQVHEGIESAYELGYEDALIFVLKLIKTNSDASVFSDRG